MENRLRGLQLGKDGVSVACFKNIERSPERTRRLGKTPRKGRAIETLLRGPKGLPVVEAARLVSALTATAPGIECELPFIIASKIAQAANRFLPIALIVACQIRTNVKIRSASLYR